MSSVEWLPEVRKARGRLGRGAGVGETGRPQRVRACHALLVKRLATQGDHLPYEATTPPVSISGQSGREKLSWYGKWSWRMASHRARGDTGRPLGPAVGTLGDDLHPALKRTVLDKPQGGTDASASTPRWEFPFT